MPNSFFGLTIGASGIFASNAGVNTTAHNISNINTKGYTRQNIVQEASYAIRVYKPYGAVGTGVALKDIEQSRNEYYDERYRKSNAQCGQYENLESYSTLVQTYLDEFNTEGFITEYNDLFKTIDALKSDPSNEAKRQQFVTYTSSMCRYFNTLSANLQKTQNDVNEEIKSSVSTINTLAEQIASLNKQINTIEASGGTSNDLRDSRNLLVDKLSYYADVSVDERDIGNGVTDYTVFFNGQQIVEGYSYNTLVCVARETDNKRNASDAEGLYDLKWNNGNPYNPYEETDKGCLKALFDMRDGCNDSYEKVVTDAAGNQSLEIQEDTFRNSSYKGIPYYQSQINQFVTVFAKEFNDIMAKGQLSDGTVSTDTFLVSRYAPGEYITALNISVNSEIEADLNKLPYSYDVNRGNENSDLYKDLYALKYKNTIKSGNFWDALSSLMSEVSVDTKRAESFTKNYSNVLSAIENQRDSVSGVDEDEEGVALVKYQHAYELSSKVISVMNQIYSKLIEETGV